MNKVLPKRPYLLRAMHEWISECGNTPHVIVDAGNADAEVPRAYVKEGKIVLNLSEGATQRLRLGNDAIEFDARFAGVIHTCAFRWVQCSVSTRARPAREWCSLNRTWVLSRQPGPRPPRRAARAARS